MRISDRSRIRIRGDLSHKTVEFHLTRIYRKLGLHARAELVARFVDEVVPPRTGA